jgi:hypothetical protein
VQLRRPTRPDILYPPNFGGLGENLDFFNPLDNSTVNFIRTLGISPVAELRTLPKNSLEFENSGSASHSHSCTISARAFRLQLPSR